MNKVKSLIFLFLFVMGSLQAYDDSPKCFRELEQQFFQKDVVYRALSLYQVNRASWSTIMRKLDTASKSIPAQIRAVSRRMSPDPIENPFQPKEAGALLLQVFYLNFHQILIDTQVESETNIQGMFNYIRAQQQSKIDTCLLPN